MREEVDAIISAFTMRALACDMEEMQSPPAWADRCRAAAAEIERCKALQQAAKEYLDTLGAALKSNDFMMAGSDDMCSFVAQAWCKLDDLVFKPETEEGQ
jgi:hypothetical protein